jgi:hypothetical protein
MALGESLYWWVSALKQTRRGKAQQRWQATARSWLLETRLLD